MARRVAYHTEKSYRINERLMELQRELPSLCTDFFRSISQTNSPLTRLAYAYDLRLFFRYLCAEQYSFANSSVRLMTGSDFEKVTAREIAGFQEYLQQYAKDSAGREDEAQGGDLSPVLVQNHELGIMRKLCTVRSFFEYLFKIGAVKANVTTLVALPKKHLKPILYLEQDEVARMMDAVLSGEGLTLAQQSFLRSTRSRDVAILMMFLGTGIRVSELVGIDIDDLDFSRNAFLVTRKGGDQSILYFADAVAGALRAYLARREGIAALPGHEHALFLSLQKRRISQRAVENLVKKYALIAAPLKKKLGPHKLRSTFGTNLYQQTGDIYLVADALGHSDVNTTRRHYAAMTDQRKREAAKRVRLPDIDKAGDGSDRGPGRREAPAPSPEENG